MSIVLNELETESGASPMPRKHIWGLLSTPVKEQGQGPLHAQDQHSHVTCLAGRPHHNIVPQLQAVSSHLQ
ncbi:hypothetical protein AMTR_s00052p00017990 [Amborella trichopoda]|uniref:Uncharacterized protein n=1 Tax=Amborella trichopoda TaxID=13333 RepID=U5D1P8_AMBTC|nr:hypothetical protein AMTR_s00052p00017990 [Amborella trichopoda]